MPRKPEPSDRYICSKTYHGTPCKRCQGTLRYYMTRYGIPRQAGPCVACVLGQVRDGKEPYRKNRYRKAEPPVVARRVITDPTLGAAFSDSIRHLVRAGRA